MKIFLSWSGDRSRGVAQVLKSTIPLLMNAADPWMSEVDIEKGERWNQALSGVLDSAKVGIFCLTPSNIQRPALLFEAGAISKSVSEARVCVLLDRLEPQNLTWPWSQFQYTKLHDQKDMYQMLADINGWIVEAGEPAVPKERFRTALDMWWPALQRELQSLPPDRSAAVPERSDREMLIEVLEAQRGQARAFAGLEETWKDLQNSLARLELGPAPLALPRTSPAAFTLDRPISRASSYALEMDGLRDAFVRALAVRGHEAACSLLASGKVVLDRDKLTLVLPRTDDQDGFNYDARRIVRSVASGEGVRATVLEIVSESEYSKRQTLPEVLLSDKEDIAPSTDAPQSGRR